jgi:signal transduction histidine kinase
VRSPGALWWGLTLRVRLLLIGLAGVATALAVGGAVLYGVLTVASYRALDQAGRATATEVAVLARSGRLPDPIPVTGNQLVQVVDARGRVVSASASGDRLTALLLPREIRTAVAGSPVVVPGSRNGSAQPLRVVAVRARPAGSTASPDTVIVAQAFADIQHSQRILGTTLLVTYPLLLLVLAGIAWRVIGAALQPVEALRSAAHRISGSGQDERLPVPASRDEIHALALTLNSMLDRLTAGRERQRAFVADAAHELRSPLASMQAQLDVSQHLGEDVRAPEIAEDLRAEVSRMARLVEDLLALARLDADPAPASQPERAEVAALVGEVVATRRRRRVVVEVDPPVGAAGPLVVLVRPDEVCRALGNLVDNAVRHAATAVQVSARADGSEVVLEVSDDGHGIAPDDRERVFERFTRLDEARDRDAGGSGLGLAIARELVDRNGGSITLDTSRAGGLCARVRLPTG